MSNKIIEKLVSERKSYKETNTFSNEPGIYALFFSGKDFPLEGCQPKADEIIYIGKTESSQASRDRDTHFATGKTGSSTLRRSFGAMLRKQMNLKPLPRGQADIEKNRTSHFKFDNASEVKITDWMISNLGLAFYPYSRPVAEIDRLETELISVLTPILNIDRKNPSNPWKSIIQALRKETGLIAYGNPSPSKPKAAPVARPKQATPKQTFTISTIDSANVHKYEDIWKQIIPAVTNAMSNGKSLELNLGRTAFDRVGNRKSYSFRLDLNNGRVVNNIGGSAVARDLARVLESNALFMNAAKGKKLVLRLDGKFSFTVSSN
ncbi:MAG: hypothetical protein KBF73_06865 [Flavobacteriales bacterium]|nr:hypothetical protein [Flavobacteriales bacterium]